MRCTQLTTHFELECQIATLTQGSQLFRLLRMLRLLKLMCTRTPTADLVPLPSHVVSCALPSCARPLSIRCPALVLCCCARPLDLTHQSSVRSKASFVAESRVKLYRTTSLGRFPSCARRACERSACERGQMAHARRVHARGAWGGARPQPRTLFSALAASGWAASTACITASDVLD
jgi:hypothetical protein